MAQRRVGGKFVKEEAQEIREAVKEFSIETFQKNIANSQNEAISALSSVQQQVLSASNDLTKLQRANEVEKQELERLHGVAAIAKDVEEAELDRDARKAEIDREKRQFEIEFNDMKAAMERSHAHALRIQKESDDRAKQAWEHDFKTMKENENAQWEEIKRRRGVDEALRTEAIERNFKERNDALLVKETELNELRTKVATFPAELEKELSKKAAAVAASIAKDHKHELEIVSSKFASEKTVLDNTISSLRQEITNKDKMIEQLQVRLASAEEKVSNIATKALETAGNVKAIAEVQTASAIASGNGTKRA